MAEKIEEVIERVLENDIRPTLKAHGGDVRVISFEKRRLNIRLLGQCSGCPSARLTAEELIGERIREKVPEVEAVILVQEISQDLLDFAKKLLNRSAVSTKQPENRGPVCKGGDRKRL